MTAQMGADLHVKLESLKIVEFSIIFSINPFIDSRVTLCPKIDRRTDKYGKSKSTFLVSKNLLEKFLKTGGWRNKLSVSHPSSPT
jgi:hypothetical protein